MKNYSLHQKKSNYFQKLTLESYQLLNHIGLSSEPAPLQELLPRLSQKLDSLKSKTILAYKDLNRPQLNPEKKNGKLGVGLNSVGMLADRLSILIIKEWCLRNKTNANLTKADELYQTQTMDIINAVAKTEPGSSSMNTKLTHHKSGVNAESWEEAFYGLLSTNILLWESQEILYVRDITGLPSEELRDYIKWFSFGNIQRNAYIEHCERSYWYV